MDPRILIFAAIGIFIFALAIGVAVLRWRFSPMTNGTNMPGSSPPEKLAGLAKPISIQKNVVQVKTTHMLKLDQADGEHGVTFDGVHYDSLEQVPDANIRASTKELLSQVAAGIKPESRIVVNGVTYHSLDEIPDPGLREIVAGALKKAGQ